MLIVLIVITVIYAVLFIPQMKKRKEAQAMMQALAVGDDIVTESGIYGRIADFDGNTVFLLIADGVEIKVSKAVISQVVTYQDAVED